MEKFSYLIPFKLENRMEKSLCEGNMGLYGLFLSIYYRRNFLYFTTILFVLGYNYFIYALGLFAFSVYLYFNYNLWKFIKLNDAN